MYLTSQLSRHVGKTSNDEKFEDAYITLGSRYTSCLVINVLGHPNIKDVSLVLIYVRC